MTAAARTSSVPRMNEALSQIARKRGIVWAEQSAANLSNDARWPADTRILGWIAQLDVCDLTRDVAVRTELVNEWIAAAGERWREARPTAA